MSCVQIDEERQLLLLTTPNNGVVPFTFAAVEMLYDMIPVKCRQLPEERIKYQAYVSREPQTGGSYDHYVGTDLHDTAEEALEEANSHCYSKQHYAHVWKVKV